MPNLAKWLNSGNELAGLPIATTQYRAALAWRRINDNPTSVELRTLAGADLAAQTVRLDWDNSASMAQGEAGAAAVRKLTMLGVKGHATVADTVIEVGYTFKLNGESLRCVHVIPQIGQIEAEFEMVS